MGDLSDALKFIYDGQTLLNAIDTAGRGIRVELRL